MLAADLGVGLLHSATLALSTPTDQMPGLYAALAAQDSGDEQQSAAGVTLQLDPTSAVAWFGESANYTVRVTNTGEAEDTFNLAVLGLPLGFVEDFDQSTVVVPGGGEGFVDVQLSIAAPVLTSVANFSFAVVAYSQADANVNDLVEGSMQALPYGVAVEFVNPTGSPESTLELKITNTGGVADTFDLSLSGEAAPAASFSVDSVTLEPGAFEIVTVDIGVIDFALPGTIDLVATATSQSHAGVTLGDVASIEIEGRLDVDLSFNPPQVVLTEPGPTTIELVVANTGNLDDNYVVEIIGTSGPVTASLENLEGELAQTIGSLPVSALSSETIVLTAELTGAAPGSITIRVRSLTDDSIVAESTVELIVQKPTSLDEIIAFGAVGGEESYTRVKIIDPATGLEFNTFTPYGAAFRGGVRVATGDVTGDGIPEVVTAPGPGRVGLVKVFTLDGTELVEYRVRAYYGGFEGGVYVALGDVDGDGRLDIVTVPGNGAAAEVLVWKNRTGLAEEGESQMARSPMRRFLAFGHTFTGGATVAAGDLTGDGKAEIIVGNGPGMGPRVRIFDLTRFDQESTLRMGNRRREIRPFNTSDRGGVFVAVGNIRGDVSQIIIGNGLDGRGEVEVRRANGSLMSEFVAYSDGSLNAPVHVAVAQSHDGGGLKEILVAQGVGSSQTWKFYEFNADLVDEVLLEDDDFQFGFFVA